MEKHVVSMEEAVDLCNRAGMRFISFAKKAEKGLSVDETEVKHDMFLLYLEAAESGHPRALYNLGLAYHFGLGVGEDHALAYRYYTEAAEKGYADALVYLAKMYALGECVNRSKEKSDELLEEAAEKGNPNACFILGGAAANRKDTASALRYFKRAASEHAKYSYCSSVSDAQSGKDYESVRDGVGKSLSKCLFFAAYLTILVLRKKEDYAAAVEWLKIALNECEMPEALIVLAHVYTYGEGAPQDFEEAERYVKMAEEVGLHGAADARDDLEEVRARKQALDGKKGEK
ncbi:MAG: SEL1-like repeat protein [Clostridia bacterium]|nr:SEL1-like repeat protein [Clostridia bacterium]